MKNYFEEFYKRYEALKSDLEIKNINALKPETVKSLPTFLNMRPT